MNKTISEKNNEILYLNEWKFWTVFLLFSALVFAYPFYTTEYINHGDAFFHMNRIEGIKESLFSGQFPVRVHGFQLNGYGTIDGIMYPDLFLYFPAVLRIFGLSVTLSWNVFWIFLIILGLFTSFIGFSIWSQNLRKGAIAAILYNMTEVGFFCLGHAVGDHIALFALPLAIGPLLKILENEKFAKYWPLVVAGFTAVFQSHILTTLILIGVIFLILLFNFKALKNKNQRTAIIKSVGFVFLLNVWFSVPFLYFYKTTALHIYDSKPHSLHDSTMDFSELALSLFYFGLPFFLLLIALFAFKRARCDKNFILSVLACAFCLFMMHQRFPWEWIETHIPGGSVLPKFQFTFRFGPLGLVFISLYMASLYIDILNIKKKYLIAISAFLIHIAAISVHPYMPIYFLHETLVVKTEHKTLDSLPSHSTDEKFLQEDYLYSDVNFYQLRNANNDYYNSNDYKTDAVIYDKIKRGTSIKFSYSAEKDTKVQVPLFYWKGYKAKDENGNNLELGFGENRFMEVQVPKGGHEVKIYYAGLKFFRFFDLISFIAFLGFCFIVYKEFKIKVKN